MSDNTPPAPYHYYPRLSNLITLDSLPSSLDFAKNIAQSIFSKIYYKNYQESVSELGDSAFYSLSIVSKTRLEFDLVYGLKFVLNRDYEDNTISSFPVTVQYNWPVIAYLSQFNLDSFSFSPEDIFNVAIVCLNTSEEIIINEAINVFTNTTGDPVNKFVDDLNTVLGGSLSAPIPYPISQNRIGELIQSINTNYGEGVAMAAFTSYILEEGNLSNTKNNLQQFFGRILPQNVEEYIKAIIKPHALVTLESSASIEFPRNILRPWIDINGELTLDPDESHKTNFDFAKALFYADTNAGIGYNLDLAGTLNPTYSEIANTGLLIQIDRLKIDLSKTKNIPEADAFGYPADFVGVYADALSVTLPPKWFGGKSTYQSTLRLAGYNLLIGTGAVTGTFALEAVPVSSGAGTVTSFFDEHFNFSFPITGLRINDNKEIEEVPVEDNKQLLTYINSLTDKNQYRFVFPLNIIKTNGEVVTINNQDDFRTLINSFAGDNDYMWLNLGKEKNSWDIGFKKFDISFFHGQVTSSHIHAALKLKKFKTDKGLSQIDFYGEWESKENFKLSANFLPDGLSMKLFKNIILTLQSAELGKSGNEFFIGADTKISIPEESVVSKLFKGKEIDLPAIRIYSNGRFEIAGGIGFIPVNFTLPLGPVEMSVTGLHLGSVQKEYKGKIRNYNYIGFDGGLSVDPIGVDIKGNGIKYYYTADDEEHGDVGDNYLHISTLQIDLIIPGTASEEQAVAVIRGSLTLPDPGVSDEYAGSVMIKLPKAKISGEASMRLNPKNKSFLVKAAVEFPSPVIPLGPVGIYGFAGLIGKKYVADKKVVFPNDAESKSWYDYYMAPEQGIGVDKFRDPSQTGDYNNPFSIGVGASLATMADGGRSFSMRAMMLLSLPSMFAIDAGLSILSERLQLTDKRVPPFYAFIIIGDDSLEFGAGANYQINKSSGWFIDIQAEIQAGFFFKNQRPWYINFGTKEKPITATLFKGILNIKAQSFLMISAAGIEAGAKVGIDFDLMIARAWVMVEVGSQISFERPQVGGYIYIEGGFSLKFLIVQVNIVVSVFFSVELIKPFLIFAQLRIQFSMTIKVIFKIKIKFNVLLTFKWEKSKIVDNKAIAPLTYQTISDPDYPKTDRTKDSVKGIHMLTGEPFDLDFVPSKTQPMNVGQLPSYPPVSTKINAILPLDTFIDIKVEKGLAPSALVDAIIGSHTGMANNHIELIPPQEVVKGGRTLRRVKHKYSIEEIEVKMAVRNSWVDYHPFEALFTTRRGDIDIPSLRIGHWQRNSDQYDTIRLMATSPFSYMDAGEPGWVVPEQYGITPSSLFCSFHIPQWNISNFLNVPLGTEYIPPTGFIAYLISGAYYNIEGTYSQSYEVDEDGNVTEVSSGGKMIVRSVPNILNHSKSLTFDNSDNLIITLPEASAEVEMNLTTYAKGVTIEVYGKVISNNIKPKYIPIGEIYVSKEQITNPVLLNLNNMGDPISLIKIIPDGNRKDRINEIHQEIAAIWAEAEANAGAGATSVILNSQQQAQLENLQKELELLRSKSCSGVSCLNLNFDVLHNNHDGQVEGNFSMIINNQNEYDELISRINPNLIQSNIDFESHSVLLLYSDYDIIVPKVVKVAKTSSNIKVQLKDTGIVFKDGEFQRPTGSRYLLIMTEKVSDIPIDITVEDIICNDSPCVREDMLCDYFERLKIEFLGQINYGLSVEDNKEIFDNLAHNIITFSREYPQYGIEDSFGEISDYNWPFYGGKSLQEYVDEAVSILNAIKKEKGNCGCVGSDGGTTESICTTSVQEVRWKTVNEYEYEQTIPGQPAITENSLATMAAMSKTVQPIWRPNTTYMLRFRLKDEVVFEGASNSTVFDYYYGFKTMGPVGHFHKQNSNYLKDLDENGNPRIDEDGEEIKFEEEEKALTSLRSYLDYKRSYPNPDGNLLGSKPLFYGNEQCKIDLFFDKPYTHHMFSTWKAYNGLDEIKMDMPIIIKDPVSEAVIPYPLPEDWKEEDVPGVEYEWVDETDPKLPLSIQTFMDYWAEASQNPDIMNCEFKLGKPIVPHVKMRSVSLTNLKPEKLYTVIVYNAYDANGNGEIKNQVKVENDEEIIIYEENQKVHEFAFRTSRYENFRKQVTSYNLNELNDNGNIAQTKQAVYEIRLDITTAQINNLYALVAKKPNAETDALRNNYIHEFDRALEGILNLKPLDPPTHTDFVKIMNNATDDVIAILVRNPEPFNDPRIPLEDMGDALRVSGSKITTLKYKILWSKDYSQSIIMHDTKKIVAKSIQLQFLYKTWDGNQRKYTVKDETDIINEDEKLNTVVTELITINK
jgi:hypothetical protein